MEQNFDSRSHSKADLSWERNDDNKKEVSQSKNRRDSRDRDKPERESFDKKNDKYYKKSSRENSAENAGKLLYLLSIRANLLIFI